MLKVVNLLAIRQGSALLARDPEGMWNFPGGKIDENESPKRALRREIKEEIPGLVILGQLTPWLTFTGVTPHSGKEVEVQTFLADVEGSIDPGAEVSATQWVEDYRTLPLTDTSKRIWQTLQNYGHLRF